MDTNLLLQPGKGVALSCLPRQFVLLLLPPLQGSE